MRTALASALATVTALAGAPLAAVAGAPAVTPPVVPPASAGSTMTFTVTCASRTQLCTPPFVVRPKISAGWRLVKITYTASPQHCSTVQIRSRVDLRAPRTGAVLDPGQSTVIPTAFLRTGTHTVRLWGIGRTGGCNAGYVGSWGGTLRFDFRRA